jgi:7,8-dihydro-6-hydroxymethylpterin-pyrophosphokinase
LLFYDKTIYSDHELKIPHEGIMNRDFVIVPLSEIAGDFSIPEKGIIVSQIDLDKLEKNIITKTDYKL